MSKIISGIQQVGIGIPNVHEAFKFYRQNFGMDVPIFEEAAEANLMLPYTGGEPHDRHAILAINLQGGGGFEIWQYTSRTPEAPAFDVQLGDLGIYSCKIKSRDVKATYEAFVKKGLNIVGALSRTPEGEYTFFVRDPYGNLFQIVKGEGWFTRQKGSHTGGPSGASIGVSDIEKAKSLYSDILGYDEVVYDEKRAFDDFKSLPGGNQICRRVLLRHKESARAGAFSRMFGPSEIELIQVEGRTPNKIYKDRFWGDLGFIHLCFDIVGMEQLGEECKAKGFPFTVNSGAFDMGEASGHFTYIEDPDGTLIEFVETHKMPIMKKFGWYLDLRKRDGKKPLPNWMLKALKFNRVKDN